MRIYKECRRASCRLFIQAIEHDAVARKPRFHLMRLDCLCDVLKDLMAARFKGFTHHHLQHQRRRLSIIAEQTAARRPQRLWHGDQ